MKNYKFKLPIFLILAAFLFFIKNHFAFACVYSSECSDNNECTTDFCFAAECEHSNSAEGIPCSGGVCSGGSCIPSDDDGGGDGDDECVVNGASCNGGAGVCDNGACRAYIIECHGDDQEWYGLFADYSDGTTSSRYYSTCVVHGGQDITPPQDSVYWGLPEGKIKEYSCSPGDFEISSEIETCEPAGVRVDPCSIPPYYAYSHCNYSSDHNYLNSIHAYCSAVPGDCGAPSNNPPEAFIDTPSEDDVYIDIDEHVSFTGHGTDADGDTISYQWSSSCDDAGTLYSSGGPVSSGASFNFNNFASTIAGDFPIYLRVQDSTGAWSTNCPSRFVHVIEGTEPPEDDYECIKTCVGATCGGNPISICLKNGNSVVMSQCITNSIACPSEPSSCPCAESKPEWKEVSP